MQKKLKIIITGFDVFGTLTYNPSKVIINFINEYIINKKKGNTSCNQDIDVCVDFFLKNHQYLKDTDENPIISSSVDDVCQQNLFCQNEKSGEKCEVIYTDKIEAFNVDKIKKHLTTLACFNENNFEFVKCELCLVNKKAVDELIQKIYKECVKGRGQEGNEKNRKNDETSGEKDQNTNSTDKVIIIHMGASAASNSITLESTATNVLIEDPSEFAKFADGNDLSTCQYIKTTLNVQKIVQQVNERSKLKVKMSCNCGTYFCNYIYYQSLKKVSGYSIPVLFVHLPLFESVNFYNQVECIKHIFSSIYDEMFCSNF